MVISALLIMIVLGVLVTKMWKDKEHLAIQQKQPVSYIEHHKRTDMLVKGKKRIKKTLIFYLLSRIYF